MHAINRPKRRFKQARDRARPGILCRADAPPRAHRAALRRDSALTAAPLATDSEKQLSGIAFKRGVDSKGFAIIKSKGDEALFGGRSTAEMKQQLGVSKSSALADRLADVLIKAKDLTNSMTAFNAEEHDLYGLDQIKQEHVENNTSVRGSLIDRGIVPENLPPAEDTKKLERRVKADEKKLKEGTDGFTDPQGRLDL